MATTARPQEPDALEAAFPRESYAPGSIATLELSTAAHDVSMRVHRVGPEQIVTRGVKTMNGVPVGPAQRLGTVLAGERVPIEIGDWASGLYFAKLTAPGRVGFAPFVVPPAKLGRTGWRSCSQRAPGRRTTSGLAQEDVEEVDGAALAGAYELLIFPGHHEYTTSAEYDAVTEFRDHGGNLAFLSANNLFWRIDVRGGSMHRVAKWRDLGRPEAALLGVQYVANDRGERKRPWLVRRTRTARRLFAGIRLKNGREFSLGGIEIDGVAPSSPANVEIVAEIPHLFGRGRSAHMTYYETSRGAKVFSAGAFTLAGRVYEAEVRQLLSNLWRALT